eukprot:2076838-Pyramimonas_sp.AAC.1
MRQRASEADEHVCNHLGCLSVSVSASAFRMLYRTELLDVFVLVQGNIAVLVLGISHSTIGACVLVEFSRAKGVLYALGIFAHGVFSAGHSDIINMLGRAQ